MDGLFEVLTASGATTLTDLKEDGFRAAGAMVRAMKDMEKDTRDALFNAIATLLPQQHPGGGGGGPGGGPQRGKPPAKADGADGKDRREGIKKGQIIWKA